MTERLQPTLAPDLVAYFRDKIEIHLSFYEDRARLIDDRYRADVEKVAKRIEERRLEKPTEVEKYDNYILAKFFRDTMDPGNIASAIEKVRTRLRGNQIVEADQVFQQFRGNLEFVDFHVRQPIFRMGLQFYYGRLRPRRDALAQLIDKALRRLGPKASAREVWNYVAATPGVNIDKSSAHLWWRNARGEERGTSFKAFQNRIAERRKLFPQPRKKI
jgi:hypothetical protein